MAATQLNKLTVLYTILRNIRRTSRSEKLRDNSSYVYVMEQYRKYAVTDNQYCQETQEMAFLAETYATYLNSSRRYKELYEEYHQSEKTVEETARMLGFKLPNGPE